MTEFKSQICTTVEQSLRLLGLGLKKETADMHYHYSDKKWKMGEGCNLSACKHLYPNYYIPAWSLYRLIEMYVERYVSCSMNLKDLTYEWIINEIEIHIKDGDFNKEYLV